LPRETYPRLQGGALRPHCQPHLFPLHLVSSHAYASSILLPEHLQGSIPGPWLTATWVGFPPIRLRDLARPQLMDDTKSQFLKPAPSYPFSCHIDGLALSRPPLRKISPASLLHITFFRSCSFNSSQVSKFFSRFLHLAQIPLGAFSSARLV
jgi:hypothetical protein